MKQNLYIILAFFSVALGSFLMIIQPFTPVTGAVIDLSTTYSRFNFFLSFGLIVSGIALMLFAAKKNEHKKPVPKKRKK